MYGNAFVLALTLATCLGSPTVQYERHEVAECSDLCRVKQLMKAFFDWALPQIDNELKYGHVTQNMKNARLRSSLFDTEIDFNYLIFETEADAKAKVDNYKIISSDLTTKFRIEIPEISETYKYKLNGTCFGHNIHGEGHLKYVMKNVSLTVSDLRFHDHPHNLQIASIKLMGNVDDLSIKFTGLKVDGMGYDKFEKVLQARILDRIKMLGHISNERTAEIEGNLDLDMFGKSLPEVVQWLRKHTKRIDMF